MIDVVLEFVLQHHSRPIGVAVVCSALFVPTSLTIFLSRPELYIVLGLNGTILFSAAMSLPILMLCYGLCYTPLSALVRIKRLSTRQLPDLDFEEAVNAEDRLEWPSLFIGGSIANFILYFIVAVAYFYRLRL